jgi:hypothetical protein
MWGSMPLITVSTTVITVLYSAEVVHIPHESWSSLPARYLLYRWAPLHTSGVCTKTSLQGCSMVSCSLQHTHWGFIRCGSPDHQGPPLAPCGSQENPFLYPLIPNQMDPKRVQLIRTTYWYAKLGSNTYYIRPYPYSLMVILFLSVVTPWTGPLIWAWWLTTCFQSPLNKPRNCWNPPNVVPIPSPKSLFSTLTRNQSNSLPGDNMDKIMVLVYYQNLDQVMRG